MAFSIRERLDTLLGRWDTRISIALHITGGVASFAVPAWAVRATDMFDQSAPASWVAAGFIGLIIFVVARLLWAAATSIHTRAKYNARFIERTGGAFNPLDLTFQNRRIYLEDFVLPSHPLVEGKTFINCDIIGPANIFWQYGNQANPIRPPVIDAVCLEARNAFNNGIIFRDCIFRNCSFQRITVFAVPELYPDWKDNANLNWISVAPPTTLIEERRKTLAPPQEPQTDNAADAAAEPRR